MGKKNCQYKKNGGGKAIKKKCLPRENPKYATNLFL